MVIQCVYIFIHKYTYIFTYRNIMEEKNQRMYNNQRGSKLLVKKVVKCQTR